MVLIEQILADPNPFYSLEYKGVGYFWGDYALSRYGVDNGALRPESPYSAVETRRRYSTVDKSYHFVNKWNDIHYPRWSFPPVEASFVFPVDMVETRSAFKLQKWFGDINENFDTSVFIAELPEAVRHITNTATDLVHCLLALRRGHISKAFSYLGIKGRKRTKVTFFDTRTNRVVTRRITGTEHKKRMIRDYKILNRNHRKRNWHASRKLGKSKSRHPDFVNFASQRFLELQYGWLPLFQDTEKLVKLAVLGARDLPKPEIRKRISTIGEATIVDSSQGSSTGDGSIRIGYDIVMQLKDPVALADHSFGVSSFKPALWEAVPLSFVVDWFIPIGQWIRGVELPTAFVLKQCTKTVKTVWETTTIGDSDPSDLSVDRAYFGGNSITTKHRSFTRAPGDLPQMSLTGVLAHASDGISNDIQHAAVAIALLKTIFLNKG